MERFYVKAISVLKNSNENKECVADIEDYIKHLKFKIAILADEVAKHDDLKGKTTLRQLGYIVIEG